MESSSITATILFTDIEGSTRLWEKEGERMSVALARHDALAKEAVGHHRGHVVKTTGDGMYAAFDDALDALNASLGCSARSPIRRPPTASDCASASGLHTGSSSIATTITSVRP